MAPALVTTTTVPAIVYATALFSDTQVDTRSHRDVDAREASTAAASAIAQMSYDQSRWTRVLENQTSKRMAVLDGRRTRERKRSELARNSDCAMISENKKDFGCRPIRRAQNACGNPASNKLRPLPRHVCTSSTTWPVNQSWPCDCQLYKTKSPKVLFHTWVTGAHVH
jgi:hypothetical protein